MKRWDCIKQKYVENKAVDNFLKEIKELCNKHKLSISHEDCHGSFIITSFNESNLEWLSDASTEIRG